MRCSYDATRLSNNVRQIECWFSQINQSLGGLEFGNALARGGQLLLLQLRDHGFGIWDNQWAEMALL